jgi:hypothetical protein
MRSLTRDEEELRLEIDIRRFEVDLRLLDANGETLASSKTVFAHPINVGGVRNFVKKEVYRLADMITEAVYIAYDENER